MVRLNSVDNSLPCARSLGRVRIYSLSRVCDLPVGKHTTCIVRKNCAGEGRFSMFSYIYIYESDLQIDILNVHIYRKMWIAVPAIISLPAENAQMLLACTYSHPTSFTLRDRMEIGWDRGLHLNSQFVKYEEPTKESPIIFSIL